MKKILYGIAFGSITLFATGCTKPILQCIDYYPRDSRKQNQCIHKEINEVLLERNIRFDGGSLSRVQKAHSSKFTRYIVSVEALDNITMCENSVISLNKELETSQKLIAYQVQTTNKKYPCAVKVKGFDSIDDAKQFANKHPRSTIKGYNSSQPQQSIKNIPSVKVPKYSFEKDKKEVVSNVNTLCDDLKKSYNYFQRKSNVEQRVIDKARRDYEECRRNKEEYQNDLRDFR